MNNNNNNQKNAPNTKQTKRLTQAIQAFTSWVNGVLDRVGENIADISTDFSDGIKLAHFLELLSGKKIGKKLELERKSDIYKIQNLYLALQFAEKDMDVKAEGVAAEGIIIILIINTTIIFYLFIFIVFALTLTPQTQYCY